MSNKNGYKQAIYRCCVNEAKKIDTFIQQQRKIALLTDGQAYKAISTLNEQYKQFRPSRMLLKFNRLQLKIPWTEIKFYNWIERIEQNKEQHAMELDFILDSFLSQCVSHSLVWQSDRFSSSNKWETKICICIRQESPLGVLMCMMMMMVTTSGSKIQTYTLLIAIRKWWYGKMALLYTYGRIIMSVWTAIFFSFQILVSMGFRPHFTLHLFPSLFFSLCTYHLTAQHSAEFLQPNWPL